MEVEYIVCRFYFGFTKVYINGVKVDVLFEVLCIVIEFMYGVIKDFLKFLLYELFLFLKFGDDFDVDVIGRLDLKMLNRCLNEE